MPEKLGYKLRPKEKGHSPEEIYQMALNRVGSPAARPPQPSALGPDSLRFLEGLWLKLWSAA